MAPRISTRAGLDKYTFHSGHLPLDLQETVVNRCGENENDNLELPTDLDEWLHVAGLTPKDMKSTEAELEDARKLREALYHMALSLINKESYVDADRTLVNHWAAERMPVPQIDDQGLTWLGNSVHASLARVAWDGVLLFSGPHSSRMRRCEGEDCGLLFVDHSRSGRRCWCDMKSCGNRAKANTYNRKHRVDEKDAAD